MFQRNSAVVYAFEANLSMFGREQQDFFKVFSHTWLIALTNIFSEISVKNFFKTPLLVAFFCDQMIC
jgi:hypothetical protein